MATTTLPSAATVRQAAVVVTALAVVGLLGALGLHAVVGPTSAGAGNNNGDEAPLPPPPDATVGVLGLGGDPLVGLDGEPLQLPVETAEPPLPDNADEPIPYDGLPPTEDVQVVGLLDAHARTLEAAADHHELGLVDRLDLFTLNGMAADDAAAGTLRDLLVDLETQAASGAYASACVPWAWAATSVDGVAPDLLGGLAAGPMARALAEVGGELGC